MREQQESQHAEFFSGPDGAVERQTAERKISHRLRDHPQIGTSIAVLSMGGMDSEKEAIDKACALFDAGAEVVYVSVERIRVEVVVPNASPSTVIREVRSLVRDVLSGQR
jgi:hypothetical protein